MNTVFNNEILIVCVVCLCAIALLVMFLCCVNEWAYDCKMKRIKQKERRELEEEFKEPE